MTTIDTKIRITALADQAIKQIRELKKAVDDAGGVSATKAATTAAAGAAAAARTTAQAGAQAQRAVKQVSEETGKSIAQTRNELRQLGPQLTDIAVGLSTGQSPFTVLLQQGGQLKDVFGGIRPAIAALATVITPVRIAIGGLLAVVGGLAVAFNAGRNESKELNRSLALTGNIAATNASQVEAVSQRVAQQQRVSAGQVRETLTALIATGQVTDTSMESAVRAVTALSRVSGRAADEVIKDFEDQTKGVATWAIKQNAAYNFLTADQVKYIRSLEAQGRAQEAVKFANEQLAASMEQRAVPALGLLERGWKAAGLAVAGFWDSLKAVGREETAEERMATLRKELERVQAVLASSANLGSLRTRARADEERLKQQLEGETKASARSGLLAAERAAAARVEQQKIVEDSKGFQAQLIAVDEAGAKVRLDLRLAGLDREKVGVDRSYALGLVSAEQNARDLTRIEQQRFSAQEAFVQRQIELAGKAVEEKPEDKIAKQKRLTELGGELAKVRLQISTAAAEGRSRVEQVQLEEARSNAQEWASIWQRAAGRIRDLVRINAASRASRTLDPEQRAAAEAEIRTEQLKRDVADQRRELQNAIDTTKDAGQRAALEEQLRALNAEADGAIAAEAAAARFASLSQQIAEQLERIRNLEAGIEQQVTDGVLSVEQAERRKNDVRQASIDKLTELNRLQADNARTPAERNQADGAKLQIDEITRSTNKARDAARGAISNGFSRFFTDVVTGAKSAKEAFRDFIGSVAQSMLDIVAKKLGEQLVASLFGSGGGSAGGGGYLQAFGTFISSFFHTGGIVGSGGSFSRAVSPLAFVSAPRYHTSGIVGLKPRERAIIAEDGEEVLDANNPRHIKNFKGTGTGVNVSIGAITVSGAGGDDMSKQAAGEDIARTLEGAMNQWAIKNSRPGGILAGR
jgi:phage-related minor tail protein